MGWSGGVMEYKAMEIANCQLTIVLALKGI